MGKIIVVEDNLVFSGYVCGMLESKGYRTASKSLYFFHTAFDIGFCVLATF